MLRLHKLASIVVSGVVSFVVTTACVLVAGGDALAAPVRIPTFGPNPGNLDMFAYSPASAGDDAPLVLVLHGCTQSAASMQAGGFEPLADELGFHLVFPQQKSANNPVSCFNWAGEFGDPANLVRGQGENQSIASMVEHMKSTQSIDPDRVFIIGFSAGGGMTSVMLATWPDLFAGGAIASGLPYRCATDVTGAFDCQNMSIHPERKKTPAQWGDLVRNAFPGFTGPRPRVFIMHGTMDFIVHSDAGIELVDQWTNVNGVDLVPEDIDMIGIGERARHRSGDGTVVVESWRMIGMGHAFPIGQDPERSCGTVAAFFEDRDICGAFRALDFFGVTGDGGGGEPDAGVPDAGMPVDAACGVDAAGVSSKEDLVPPVDDDDEQAEASGCAAGGGAGGGVFYALLALALVSARRRRAARSSLPVPVRGSSGTSS
jgi:poly(hydroxyalkanoate) depolymerase family esterase